VAAAAFVLAAVVGCDAAEQAADKLSDMSGSDDASAIPADIADACLTIASFPVEIKFSHGHRLGDLVQLLEETIQAENSTWEESRKGYIWRWSFNNQLEQARYDFAIEFARQAPRAEPPYPGDECGPVLVQAEAGVADGEPLSDTDIASLFRPFSNGLDHQRTSQTPQVPVPEPDNTVAPSELRDAQQSSSAITQGWLIGTWGPADYNPSGDPNASCDTDAVVTFKSDGSYTDGGGYGRYRTNGRTITYFNRVLVDVIEDTVDRSQYGQPLITDVERVDRNTLREDGNLLRRCSPD